MNALLKRLSTGFGRAVFASFAAAVAACMILLLAGGRIPAWSDVLGVLRSLFFYIFVVAFVHALLLGLPCAWLMRRLRAKWMWTMAAGGFVVGALPMWLFTHLPMVWALCGASGVAGAVALYWMDRAIERRPAAA
ncbi:MAG: hypothetical protein ACTHOH_10785 [Lysobacteraceae bacterium]